eukprot:Em0030g27a
MSNIELWKPKRSSDSVSPLDMAEPIAQQLTALETEGVFTYDALHQETVLVVAPLMCIVCDNPRASVLLNQLGSAALKHCPQCMTTRKEDPDTVCAPRMKAVALQQIAQISTLLTEALKSFVGRDFKGWMQMALFIISLYLSDGQKEVLLALSKVFKIAYCDFFKPILLDEWKRVCQGFVSAAKQHMPSLLEKQKTHLILHLVDSSSPSTRMSGRTMCLGTDWPLAGISQNVSVLCNICVTYVMHTTTLDHMLQCGMQYDIVLGMFALTDEVVEHRAIVSQSTVLVNSGDYVELVVPQCNMKYGILLATFKCTDGTAHCLVQGFHELTLSDGREMVNDYDCPLLDLSTTIFCTTGNNVQRPVSFVHECSATCLCKETGTSRRSVEREIVEEDTLVFEHDWKNTMYCYCTL